MDCMDICSSLSEDRRFNNIASQSPHSILLQGHQPARRESVGDVSVLLRQNLDGLAKGSPGSNQQPSRLPDKTGFEVIVFGWMDSRRDAFWIELGRAGALDRAMAREQRYDKEGVWTTYRRASLSAILPLACVLLVEQCGPCRTGPGWGP